MPQEKKVFVRTTYTAGKDITAHKLYPLFNIVYSKENTILRGSIIDDVDYSIIVCIENSSHIGFTNWEVVHE